MALRSKILGDSLLKVNEGSSAHAHGTGNSEIKTLAPRTLCVEYVWVSGQAVSGLTHELRSKMRTFVQEPKDISDYPEWVVDGRSSHQRTGLDPEIILRPIFTCADPFRGPPHRMVLCDAIKLDHTPLASNKRPEAIDQAEKRPLMLAFRQDAVFLQQNKKMLLGEEQSPLTREIADSFLKACLFAGIRLSDINKSSHCSISYQLAPSKGAWAGDQLWLSRYILCRVAENFKVCCSFEPQLEDPLAPSCGCEVTIAPVEASRPQWAVQAGEKLAAATLAHMRVYGPGNEERFERCETLPCYILSTVVKKGGGTRGATVWISDSTDVPHVIDRRPAGNCDPYAVIGRIAATLYNPLDGVTGPVHVES